MQIHASDRMLKWLEVCSFSLSRQAFSTAMLLALKNHNTREIKNYIHHFFARISFGRIMYTCDKQFKRFRER